MPRPAGDAGNTDCPGLGRCWVPPSPGDCRKENASSIDCRQFAYTTIFGGGNLNAQSVSSTGAVTFGNGQFVTLPVVADSF